MNSTGSLDAARAARFPQYLARSLLAVLGGLPIGALVGGLVLGFYVLIVDGPGSVDLAAAIGLGLLTAMVAIFVGILPAFLYGAPIYALLAWKRLANIATVSILGSAPGLALVLATGTEMSWLVLGFGVSVALATHAIARRGVESVAREA